MSIVNDLTLEDLGFGAGMALWGFRACAMGCSRCKTLAEGYHRTLQDDGGAALIALARLAREIGKNGSRKVILMPTGYIQITADELSLIAALAAAQDADEALCKAHLTWILASTQTDFALSYATSFSTAFARRGLEIRTPDINLSTPVAEITAPTVRSIGHA